MRALAILGAAAALILPVTAQAQWLEASSPHFVVYSDDSERDVRRFSEQLEIYHQAMELMTGVDLPAPSPSNRVTVYVVKNEKQVQKLHGGDARYIGGFYVPRAGGSLAIIPRPDAKDPTTALTVLLHEYAHHFLISESRMPLPRWVGEGAAELFAAADFTKQGGIKIGLAAGPRMGELIYAKDVKVSQLLDPQAYADGARKGYDAFYGKSWLLYHYLTLGGGRPGQLVKYLELLGRGKSSPEAGLEAFGDLAVLEREIDAYLQKNRFPSAEYPADRFKRAEVSIRQLSAGEGAVMPLRIQSKRGVNREQALGLLPEARKVAAAHPNDPAVLAALAEAEYDAGEDRKAVEAADAALALDPTLVNAYVQKGYALFRLAEEEDDPNVAYRAAVQPFMALNKIENDHPLPLIYYHRSFGQRGVKAPEIARQGLERAAVIAPFDLGLRMNLAVIQLTTGEIAAARSNLLPIAYNPHGGAMADAARRTIELIDDGESSGPALLAQLAKPPEDSAAGE